MTMSTGPQPVSLQVAAPQGARDKASVALRLIFAIPPIIVLYIYSLIAMVFAIISWFQIILGGTMSKSAEAFIAKTVRYGAAVLAYLLLLTDRMPALDASDHPDVRVRIAPAAEQRDRLSVGLRLIYIIPHAIIVGVLMDVAYVIAFIAWLMILFAGGYPQGVWDFSVGTLRWYTRYAAYAFLLTDIYPPFSLEEGQVAAAA